MGRLNTKTWVVAEVAALIDSFAKFVFHTTESASKQELWLDLQSDRIAPLGSRINNPKVTEREMLHAL